MPAYRRLSVREFLSESDSTIIGDLAQANAAARFQIPPEQIDAWRLQAGPLRGALQELVKTWTAATEWGLLLEYPIPRIGKRIDAVLLAHNFVVVIEFKTGHASTAGVRQVEEYALCLSYFHEPSHALDVVPLLVRTDGRSGSVGSASGRVAATELASFCGPLCSA